MVVSLKWPSASALVAVNGTIRTPVGVSTAVSIKTSVGNGASSGGEGKKLSEGIGTVSEGKGDGPGKPPGGGRAFVSSSVAGSGSWTVG